jgi:tripartite-type tricarboxylate transporter receptor subunit TctC
MVDVLAGQVQVFMSTPFRNGCCRKLKALAVTGKSRHPMLPNVPTIAEAGVNRLNSNPGSHCMWFQYPFRSD